MPFRKSPLGDLATSRHTRHPVTPEAVGDGCDGFGHSTQREFFKKTTKPVTKRIGRKHYDDKNREAATIILANPDRYGGLPIDWACRWKANHERKEFNAD